MSEPDLLAAFELSYNQLQEEDQKRWRMLGVFSASFAITAAQAMWELEENETRKQLSLFGRYSLLDYDETSSRYSLHDLLAEYACSLMIPEDEYAARLKHASHYKDVLSAADDLYLEGSENVLLGLRLFDLEWDNIRAGQAWLTSAPQVDPVIAELCKAYPNAGTYVLDLRQHPRERIGWLEAAVSAAREIEDQKSESYALGNLGNAYADLGDARKAIEYHEQSLVIKREIGDRKGEGNALGNLGLAYGDLGEARKAIEYHEQALVISRETGDRRGEGQDLGNLGIAYYSLGEARKAIEYYEQALVIDREIGDRRGEGAALGNLGNAYADLGEARKAIEYYEQSLVIKREIGDRRGEGNALGNLGIAYADLGDARKAIEYYEQHLVITREIGDRIGEGNALFNMGLALHGLEERERAIDLVKQALSIREAIESPLVEKTRNKLKEWGALPADST
jgi:tetratricopeptide (TPR) repeat protein